MMSQTHQQQSTPWKSADPFRRRACGMSCQNKTKNFNIRILHPWSPGGSKLQDLSIWLYRGSNRMRHRWRCDGDAMEIPWRFHGDSMEIPWSRAVRHPPPPAPESIENRWNPSKSIENQWTPSKSVENQWNPSKSVENKWNPSKSIENQWNPPKSVEYKWNPPKSV